MSADVEEDDNAYFVSCQLPGIDPKDVNISAQGNVLTISGETKRSTPEGRREVSRESSYGRFERSFSFETPIETDKAEATFRDGILEVTLPKAETHKPRTIQIRQEAPQQVEAPKHTETAEASEASKDVKESAQRT